MNLRLTCLLSLFLSLSLTSQATDKPNFVFIFADDMGWTGTSVEMIPGDARTKSDYYLTPNLEKLAEQGMRFSAAYAPAAMCTPSRAAVLTGKTPAELHITNPGPGLGTIANKLRPPTQLREFPDYEVSIAEILKPAGYASAYFGKWHLGQGNPGQHGFDVHDGSTSNGTPGNEPADNPKDIYGLNKRAMAFMKENVEAEKPFYVQLFHYAVHGPTAAHPDSQSKFQKLQTGKRHSDAPYAGMTWDLDVSIGTLMEEIESLGIADNTYVVFLSDNGAGGRQNNAPLNGGKSTLFEGGIRVPMIIAGPGIPANSHSAVSVTGCDLFPTFCEWAGVDVDHKIDGSSLTSLLSGKTKTLERHVSSLLFHKPHYGRGPTQTPSTAIIAGDYKLIRDYETNQHYLFNLAKDLGESKNLATSDPDRLEAMVAMMDERLASVNAQMIVPNPDYDPTAVVERRGPRGGGQGGRDGGGQRGQGGGQRGQRGTR